VADEASPAQRRKNRRESIESFVVVFVAFLVFSLEAEGFVIPTGSMAPTLMGRHKEIVCPECGDVYTVNADCEVDSSGSGAATGIRVVWGTCQNCRFTTRVDDAPSVSGDRIYTMKKDLALPLLPQAGRVGPGRWEVATLLVDGLLPFGAGRLCEPEGSWTRSVPATADLEPARIAAQGANLEVTQLVLKRDIYYTLQPGELDQISPDDLPQEGPRGFFDLLADPARYASLGPPPGRDYPLGPGRYLMLGDNSPWSRDGRAWGRKDQIDQGDPDSGWDDSGRESWEVPESLIIGKAFCVYWPHLKPAWPEFRLGPDQRFPVRPYFERIRWIR